MELPRQIIPASRKDPRLQLIYGPPKIGKTTLLSKIPNNLIIDTEQGSEFVDALKIKINSLAELNSLCTEVINQGKPYRFASVDTIDKIEEWAEAHATMMYKASAQGKNFTGSSVLNLPNGGGYLWLRQSFIQFINKVSNIARNIIFVGHIRDKMIESAGKEVSAKDLDLTGKIKSIICSQVDAIGYISRTKEGKLFITYKTQDEVVCGSRCEHLKGQTFTFDVSPDSFDWKKIYIDEEPRSVLI